MLQRWAVFVFMRCYFKTNGWTNVKSVLVDSIGDSWRWSKVIISWVLLTHARTHAHTHNTLWMLAWGARRKSISKHMKNGKMPVTEKCTKVKVKRNEIKWSAISFQALGSFIPIPRVRFKVDCATVPNSIDDIDNCLETKRGTWIDRWFRLFVHLYACA